MNLSEKDRAIYTHCMNRYKTECRAKGIPIYSPQLGHTCTDQCKQRIYQDYSYPVAICTGSWKIHLCGSTHCKLGELSSNSEYVCPLTGTCLSSLYVEESPYSKDRHGSSVYRARGVITKTTSSTELENGMEKIPSVRKLERVACIQCISSYITLLLTASPKRVAIHKKQIERFYREDIRRFRSLCRGKKYVDVVETHMDILAHIDSMASALNPPATDLTPAQIRTLSLSFCDYYDRLVVVAKERKISLPYTTPKLAVFVASMCDFLSKGVTINKTTIVKKHWWFAFHAPYIKNYGDFEPQFSRSMSKFERVFRDLCNTPNTKEATFNLVYTIPDSFIVQDNVHTTPTRDLQSTAPPTFRAGIASTQKGTVSSIL